MRKSYRLNEADISPPDYWKDTTINTFILPSSKKNGEAGAAFVTTRDVEAVPSAWDTGVPACV